jgi:hypothetical protein
VGRPDPLRIGREGQQGLLLLPGMTALPALTQENLLIKRFMMTCPRVEMTFRSNPAFPGCRFMPGLQELTKKLNVN